VFAKLKTILLAALVAAAGLASSPASAMTVQPVVLNLATVGRDMTQVLTVTNSFAFAIAVELKIEELTVDAEGVQGTGKDPGDLLVFPPQASIRPGQTQSFRVQYVGDPALARSRHYYVTVAQLPVQVQQGGAAAVQVLYNFQVLVSVAPQGTKPAIRVDRAAVERTADGKAVPVVSFSNPSPAHGYLSNGRIRVVQRDAAGREAFRKVLSAPEVQQAIGYGLIGAGQTRKVTLPIELPQAGGTLEAQYTPDS
jgi:fimbrial chaperone protein